MKKRLNCIMLIDDDADDNQECPNHHYVLNAQLTCVHPTPDECPDTAGNDADNTVHNSRVLKLLYQHQDKTDKAQQA